MAFLGRVATRIINEVKGVNRVVYDVTRSRRARSSGNIAVYRGVSLRNDGMADGMANLVSAEITYTVRARELLTVYFSA
jgi:hypothetical protein